MLPRLGEWYETKDADDGGGGGLRELALAYAQGDAAARDQIAAKPLAHARTSAKRVRVEE